MRNGTEPQVLHPKSHQSSANRRAHLVLSAGAEDALASAAARNGESTTSRIDRHSRREPFPLDPIKSRDRLVPEERKKAGLHAVEDPDGCGSERQGVHNNR